MSNCDTEGNILFWNTREFFLHFFCFKSLTCIRVMTQLPCCEIKNLFLIILLVGIFKQILELYLRMALL